MHIADHQVGEIVCVIGEAVFDRVHINQLKMENDRMVGTETE